MKQTAVEWLVDELILEGFNVPKVFYDKAKEMEKEQIVEAFFQGVDRESDGHGAMYLCRKDAEQYYKETYESNT